MRNSARLPDRSRRALPRWLRPCLCVIVLASSSVAMAEDGPAIPALGAHTLLTQPEGEGTAPAATSPVHTQDSGSTLLVLVAGHRDNDSAPTDSYGNAWAPVGEPMVYHGYDGRFDARAYVAISARGGKRHTVQVAKPGSPEGEVSLPFVEIAHAGKLQDVARNYPAPSLAARAGNKLARAWQDVTGDGDSTRTTLSSGSVTTTGPAVLVAVWLGDAYIYSMTAVPGDGFKVIDSYLELPPASGVQCAVAVKQVTQPGTYSVSWTGSPAQGAILWLFAFQASP